MTVSAICKHCHKPALVNTSECIDHHNARLDALWAARWARFEALPFEEGDQDEPPKKKKKRDNVD